MKTLFQTTFKIACVLACATAAGGTLAAVRYECQTMQAGTYVFAGATSINSAGELAGYSDYPTSGRNATWWSANGDANALDGYLDDDAYGTGINDYGHVVGYAWVPDVGYVAVSWDNDSTPTALGLLPGDHAGYAHDVNNRGVIVGISRSSQMSGRSHAVMWRNGKVIDLGTLGSVAKQASRNSSASGINRQGEVVGSSDTEASGVRAVRWDTNRQIHDLGTLPGAQKSWASAINDKGVIVGYGERAAGDKAVHAIAWVDGAIHDLGVLPGHKQSRAHAVNRSGTVVGTGTEDDIFLHPVALVWSKVTKAPRDLNTLLTNRCESGLGVYTLTDGAGINRDGVIAATGEYIDGLGGVHTSAFKLVPVPVADADVEQ